MFNLDTCRSSIERHYRPTLGRHSADISADTRPTSRPTLERLWADTRATIGRHSGDYLPTIGRHLGDYRPTLGQHSGDYRPILNRHLSTPIGRQLSTAIGRHSCIGRVSTNTVSRHSTDISADSWPLYRPILDQRYLTDILADTQARYRPTLDTARLTPRPLRYDELWVAYRSTHGGIYRSSFGVEFGGILCIVYRCFAEIF